jgi:hypothetical protein
MLNSLRNGIDAHPSTDASRIIRFVLPNGLAFRETRKERLVNRRIERSQNVKRPVAMASEAVYGPRRYDDAGRRLKKPRLSAHFDTNRAGENEDLFLISVPMSRHTDTAGFKDLFADADLLGAVDLTRPTSALHAGTPFLPLPFTNRDGDN